MEVTVSDGIAEAALLLSGFALWRQRGLDELTKRLNSLQIQKEEGDATASKQADVLGNFVRSGKNSYLFRVYNRGKGVAGNVRMEVILGDDLFASGDIKSKLPYPSLHPQQSFDMMVRVHMQSSRRATVKLLWDDDAGGGSKEITADVF